MKYTKQRLSEFTVHGYVQETDRMTVNELVDERTRMEYYYPPFAGAIEAGWPWVLDSFRRRLVYFV
jgi:hypothetical protein